MFWTLSLAIATGMRTMTAMAVVCWAAYLGYLPVQGTWAFWTANLATVIVFTVLALGEYVGDTLPRTPNRTDLFPLLARLFFGVLIGVLIATVMGQPKIGGILLGVLGVLIGAYGGFRVRMLAARIVRHDLPVALIESGLALWLSMHALQEICIEFSKYAVPAVLYAPR
jgi:uncharacterized membrane protein